MEPTAKLITDPVVVLLDPTAVTIGELSDGRRGARCRLAAQAG